MALSTITIRSPHASEFPLVLRLRYEVLDKPLGLPEKTILGNSDQNPLAIHRAGFDGNRLVCTVRLDPYGEDAYLVRRMATDPGHQGKGVGARVLSSAEQEARSRGAHKIILHARIGAIAFYKKLGYQLTGHIEVHDGDENPEMVKAFSKEIKL